MYYIRRAFVDNNVALSLFVECTGRDLCREGERCRARACPTHDILHTLTKHDPSIACEDISAVNCRPDVDVYSLAFA